MIKLLDADVTVPAVTTAWWAGNRTRATHTHLNGIFTIIHQHLRDTIHLKAIGMLLIAFNLNIGILLLLLIETTFLTTLYLPAVGIIILSLLSLIHISEPTRLLSISYAVFCLKKKKTSC
eukprot:TRINITY_DN27073_c0_g1_i1.p2 TRINITY_DN27073_c0_g1~~TRINITY_DN27073_c0_g1_i1.p2  ORF type:complete len:120 (+),score=27.50 TRINITY_DN27073_c0_g1_i1:712-1071(+)